MSMIACPNKTDRDWVTLVNKIGVVESYREFVANNYQIPDPSKYENTFEGVNATLKVVDALEKIQQVKYTKEKSESFFNAVKKQGVPQEQVNLLEKYIIDNNIQEINKVDLILGLLSETSYNIKIDTAETSRVLEDTPTATTVYRNFEFKGESFTKNDELDFDGEYKEVYRRNGKQIKRIEFIEFAKKAEQVRKSVPTQYYSNLTVPGGTNYTENEIASPAITPSIKGHAQFATDNGIGWFRSDEKQEFTEDNIKKIEEELGIPRSQFNSQSSEFANGIATKIRRILEVQSDLFQKGRDIKDLINVERDPDTREIIGESRAKESKENSFLQLLNKDNNWVTFFVKSIIQDSAKKGYEKVLFPSGNTASKVEGHTTLEEFKKDRVQRIENIENTKNTVEIFKRDKSPYEWGMRVSGIETKYLTKELAEEAKEDYFKDLDRQIEQYKQELERIEKEGFGALKPIWNFYENTVTNILKKQNLKLQVITDEYGNTWNEVTIEPKQITDTILFRTPNYISNQFPIPIKDTTKGIKDYEKEFGIRDKEGNYKRYSNTTQNIIDLNKKVGQINTTLKGTGFRAKRELQDFRGKKYTIITISNDPAFRLQEDSQQVNNELNSKIKEWLTKLGIKLQYYDTLNELYKENPIAVADFLEKVIRISKAQEDGLALPEEAMHFAIELRGTNDPLVQRLMELVVETPEYREVKEQYAGIYKTEEQFRKEAIGKIGANILFTKNTQNNTTLYEDFKNLITQLWNEFLNIFKSADENQLRKEIDYILGKISDDIIDVKTEDYKTDNLEESQLFRLSEDYKSEQKVLKEAIDNTYNRIRNLVARDQDDVAKGQKALYDKLKNQLEKEQYRLGLYNFVAASRIDGATVAKEFNNLEDETDLNLKVKTLNKISRYISSYKPVLEDISNTLKQEGIETSIQDKVNKSIRDIDQLYKSYISVSKNIIADLLKPYALKSDGTSINLKTALDYLENDISFVERWLDAAAEVNDDIIQITDKLVKELKEEARLRTQEDEKDIVAAKIKLEKAGVPLATWVYERKNDGKLTGYFIDKYNKGEYDEVKNKFYEELRQEFNLEKGRKPKVGTKERKVWARKIREWHEENSKVKDNVKDIIEARKKEIFERAITKEQGQIEWDEWVSTNIGFSFDAFGNEIQYYRGELTEPAEKYISSSWLEIYNKKGEVRNNEIAKAKDEFLTLIKNKKAKADALLPEKYRSGNLAPQVIKDTLERLKSSENIKGFIETELKNRFVRNEDDIDFGLKITDETGIPLNFLPVYHTRKLKDTTQLSTDIVTSMVSYMHMANNYSSMNKIVDLLDIESDILRERKVGTGEYALLSVFSNKEPIVKKGDATNSFNRFQDYIKMVVYGERKIDEGNIEFVKRLFGTEVDKAKTIDAFGKYVSMNSLALNVYSGISNITYGSAMIRQEAIAGEYFTNKDLLYADKIYTSNLAGILSNVGKRLKDNKLDLYIEKMNVLQDYEEQIREIDGERKTRFEQLANSSALYVLNKSGEHWMQTRTSLALANTIKLKSSDGKIINLFDAFEVRDNRLVLMQGLTIVADGKTFKALDDGKLFTEKELIRVVNKQNFINKRLHGIYNNIDKSAIQKYALGRLAVMFRKFMVPGFNRRYAKLQYNYEGETYTEGYYRTTGRFALELIKDLRKLQFTLGGKWNELQDFEKRNMFRTLTEVSYFIAATVLVAVISNIKGDDEEDWALNMMAYQANRLYSEIRFYSSPTEFLRILSSPAAGIDQAQKIINFLEFYNWFDEIERGRYQGYTKFEKGLIDVIPFASTTNKFLTPDEQLKYFAK